MTQDTRPLLALLVAALLCLVSASARAQPRRGGDRVVVPLAFHVDADRGRPIASDAYLAWVVEKANRWLAPAGVCVAIADVAVGPVPVDFDVLHARLATARGPLPVGVPHDLRLDGEPFAGTVRTSPRGAAVSLSRTRAGDRTLAHELGHLFGLAHVDDARHVMHSSSPNLRTPTRLTRSEARAVRRAAERMARTRELGRARCVRYDLDPLDEVGPGHPLLYRTTRVFTDRVYVGELLFGDPHGQGTTRWRSGAAYDGGYRFGDRHGRGEMRYAGGGSYQGAWRDGRFEGRGVQVYRNGDVYFGEFHRGRRHGDGVYVSADGGRYDGGYRNGERIRRRGRRRSS